MTLDICSYQRPWVNIWIPDNKLQDKLWEQVSSKLRDFSHLPNVKCPIKSQNVTLVNGERLEHRLCDTYVEGPLPLLQYYISM